ncbi:hypothetical protein IU450_21585 [Nocardia abscessus]|uniref:hypothetical protein n=1 Tax=Nocardia abscessus TaxID=120957 RepID=UPI00189408B0|nr:hypothetical protein [Nocardia abscessus]MBF6338466.1 hypothetical protein [Nocardia abscessus]
MRDGAPTQRVIAPLPGASGQRGVVPSPGTGPYTVTYNAQKQEGAATAPTLTFTIG